MTMTAWFRVEDISEGPAPITVRLSASADEKVKPYAGKPGYDHISPTYETPALTSNTEGRVRAAELLLLINEDTPGLKVGDFVNFNGHFDWKPDPEA